LLHFTCHRPYYLVCARGAGTIVTVGSTGGRFTSPGTGAYHIVKYGVEALSLALRAEVAQFGVRVVLIDPTGVRTRFVESQLEATRSYADDDPYGEFKRRYAETTRALTKMPGVMVGAGTVAARSSGPSRPKIPSLAISSAPPGRPPYSPDCS